MTLTFRRRPLGFFLAIAFFIASSIAFVPRQLNSSTRQTPFLKTTNRDPSRSEERKPVDVANTARLDLTSWTSGIDGVLRSHVANAYGKLSLNFEENQGQADDEVKFLSRGNGYSLFLTSTDAVLRLRRLDQVNKPATLITDGLSAKTVDSNSTETVLRMKLVGANPRPGVAGVERQTGKSNYFIGNDPTKWRTNVPRFARVEYHDVYRGVNVVYYGTQEHLEYDFVVEAGADPGVIKLRFDGASAMQVSADGSLRLQMLAGELRQPQPTVYQELNGEKKRIAGSYRIHSPREVGFEIADYDHSRPLIIDPVLSYASYLGGSRVDEGYGIAVDSFGNAYVVGLTESTDFPTVNSRPPGNDFYDVFVTKVNAAGSAMLYSTYLGGRQIDRGFAIAVDSSGSAYVTGLTNSPDFPTESPVIANGGGTNAFVTKLSPEGSALIYSTCLGGNARDEGHGIAIDQAGSAYVTGQTDSPDFPTSANSFQPAFGGFHFGGDAFVTKVNPTGSIIVYSTFLGGEDYDEGKAIAVDSSGNAYVTGATHSRNFPTANAYQSTINSFCSAVGTPIAQCMDAFVTKLNSSGSALVYSSFLGGFGRDEGHAIAVDSSGNAYVAGETNSANFPIANAFQPQLTGSGSFVPASDAFITKLSPAGSALIYSTFLGGSGSSEHLGGMAVDAQGNVYVAGQTGALDFPTVDPVQPLGGGGDAFVTKLSASGTALIYSTYFGGSNYDEASAIAVDSAGNAYITGRTWGDLPTVRPFQAVFGGSGVNVGDAFVAKIGNAPIQPPNVLAISAVTPGRGGNSGSVTINIYGTGFKTGATVKLVRAGEPNITAAAVGVSEDSFIARARFEMSGQAPGLRDVVLTNPDGQSTTRGEAFTIVDGGKPQMWVDIIGRDRFRPGRTQTYYIAYGNRGNVDATMVPITLVIPKSAEYELLFKFIAPPQPAQGTFDFSQIQPHFETETEKVIPLFIPIIAAQASGFLGLRVTGGDQPLRLIARVNQVYPILFTTAVSNSSAGSPNVSNEPLVCFSGHGDCLSTIGAEVTNCGVGFVDPPDRCKQAIREYEKRVKCSAITTAGDAAISGQLTESGVASSGAQVVAGGIATGVSCATGEFPLAGQLTNAMHCGFGEHAIEEACPDFGPFTWVAEKIVIPLLPGDPNDKFGSTGAGVRRYISNEEKLRYAISFENMETANAPAQDVVITDQLDPSKLDFDAFSLGPISFGKDKLITPPAGLSEFNTDVDLRPQKNLIVRINIKLDKSTGLLTWRFTSIDPATGLPTEDPTAGFLPPNRTAPEGEGQVLFTVQPKGDITTGTEIRNRARIVFDNNPVIDTPEWLNTIDNTRPSSRILPLPATQCATGVHLQWAGTDAGSGISDFTILLSDNNGPVVPLVSNTTATSLVFQGQVGHTYSFYSIARDKTQNFEEPHASPDATISIVGVSPPTITAPPALTVQTGATATSCGAFISDAQLGSAVARSNCLGVTVTRDGVPANHFFPVGNTVINHTATDGAGNSSSASQLVTVIDNTPPKISDVTVDKPSLWPPNHKMVDVALKYDVIDNCGPTTCQVGITSNEPINGTGDGDSYPDWEVLNPYGVRLRAERSGKGNGRIYLIKVTCTDGARNSANRTVTVTVPSSGK